jgi:hypothetical protein
MPELWVPGLIKDPGRSAGYPQGRVWNQWLKHHDTAGTNSYEVCKWGRPGYRTSLCTILLPKVGAGWQFCEFDSMCSDAGKFNVYGPSVEVERFHDDDLTPDQIESLRLIGEFAEAEWDIPNVPYRGDRFDAEGWRGHINHSDFAYNPDGLTVAEWEVITLPAAPPTPLVEDEDMTVWLVLEAGPKQGAHVQASPYLIWHKRNVNEVSPGRSVAVNHAEIDAIYADVAKARTAAGI